MIIVNHKNGHFLDDFGGMNVEWQVHGPIRPVAALVVNEIIFFTVNSTKIANKGLEYFVYIKWADIFMKWLLFCGKWCTTKTRKCVKLQANFLYCVKEWNVIGNYVIRNWFPFKLLWEVVEFGKSMPFSQIISLYEYHQFIKISKRHKWRLISTLIIYQRLNKIWLLFYSNTLIS